MKTVIETSIKRYLKALNWRNATKKFDPGKRLAGEQPNGYDEYMKLKLLYLPQIVRSKWTAKLACMALGDLLSAAALMRVDMGPMEGFDRDQFDKVLGLKKGLTAAILTPVGFSSQQDKEPVQRKSTKACQ